MKRTSLANERRKLAIQIARRLLEERIRRELSRVVCVMHGPAAMQVQIRYAGADDPRGSVECKWCCEAMKPLLVDAIRRAVEHQFSNERTQ